MEAAESRHFGLLFTLPHPLLHGLRPSLQTVSATIHQKTVPEIICLVLLLSQPVPTALNLGEEAPHRVLKQLSAPTQVRHLHLDKP